MARSYRLIRMEPRGAIMALAEQLAKTNDMLLCYTRMVLTHPLRKQLDEGLQYFLAIEALSTLYTAQQQ